MSHVPSIFVGNTSLLEVRELKAAADDEFINDAAVSVTLKDAAGTDVTGETWPVEMEYVAASDGWYRAALSHELDLEAGETYYAHIDADAGEDRVGHWEYAFVAKTRRST